MFTQAVKHSARHKNNKISAHYAIKGGVTNVTKTKRRTRNPLGRRQFSGWFLFSVQYAHPPQKIVVIAYNNYYKKLSKKVNKINKEFTNL